MRTLLALLLATIAFGPTSSARAECAKALDFISQPSGSTVPANPTLFLFVPRGTPDRRIETTYVSSALRFVSADGTTLRARVDRLSPTPVWEVFRVQVAATSGEVLVYVPWNKDVPRYRYTIQETRAPKGPSAIQVTSTKTHANYWICSHTLTAALGLSLAAPAYRIEWAESEQAFTKGKRQAFVVPGAQKDQSDAAGGLVELGHHNCVGHSFEWKGKPVWLSITALQADGTESPPMARPVRVDPPVEKPDAFKRGDETY